MAMAHLQGIISDSVTEDLEESVNGDQSRQFQYPFMWSNQLRDHVSLVWVGLRLRHLAR